MKEDKKPEEGGTEKDASLVSSLIPHPSSLLTKHLRSGVRSMAGYTPGEQPRQGGITKLNTNENPYPPSPRVLEAIREALTGERLRKYPDPLGARFRQVAGRVLGVDPDGVVIGNGSDDILTILTRAFVPQDGFIVSLTPSYLLYRTLAELQGARLLTVPFTADWKAPDPWPGPPAHLTFLANPNSPSGTVLAPEEAARLSEQIRGPLVVDEAYTDFAESHCLPLAVSGRVIVTRTLSKSYALAGIRFGFAVTTPELARELVKVKDSYNCDVLSLAAATAALEDQEYRLACRAKILATRARLEGELRELGFTVTPSQANFVWCRRTDRPVQPLYLALKERNILIRYMTYEGYGDGLRVSVGTDQEIDRLLAESREILKEKAGFGRISGDRVS
jgi:histidinol-phosphate aminotransferase